LLAGARGYKTIRGDVLLEVLEEILGERRALHISSCVIDKRFFQSILQLPELSSGVRL